MTTNIYIVRHGQTIWNKEKRMQGSLNSPLTETGELQANLLGQSLINENIDVIYSSSSPRAQQTSKKVNNALNKDIILMPELEELDMGVWEGMTHEDIETKYPDEWHYFWHDPDNYQAANGGESFDTLVLRSLSGFQQIIADNPGKNILLVSHRITIKFLLATILGQSPTDLPDSNPTSLSKIKLTNDGYEVAYLNNIDHYLHELLA